ncbi:hypothetical protein LX36DRAFT_100000, partial [Colletotrichum falcatum]
LCLDDTCVATKRCGTRGHSLGRHHHNDLQPASYHKPNRWSPNSPPTPFVHFTLDTRFPNARLPRYTSPSSPVPMQ